jgi:hypothetical protein
MRPVLICCQPRPADSQASTEKQQQAYFNLPSSRTINFVNLGFFIISVSYIIYLTGIARFVLKNEL